MPTVVPYGSRATFLNADYCVASHLASSIFHYATVPGIETQRALSQRGNQRICPIIPLQDGCIQGWLVPPTHLCPRGYPKCEEYGWNQSQGGKVGRCVFQGKLLGQPPSQYLSTGVLLLENRHHVLDTQMTSSRSLCVQTGKLCLLLYCYTLSKSGLEPLKGLKTCFLSNLGHVYPSLTTPGSTKGDPVLCGCWSF